MLIFHVDSVPKNKYPGARPCKMQYMYLERETVCDTSLSKGLNKGLKYLFKAISGFQ